MFCLLNSDHHQDSVTFSGKPAWLLHTAVPCTSRMYIHQKQLMWSRPVDDHVARKDAQLIIFKF